MLSISAERLVDRRKNPRFVQRTLIPNLGLIAGPSPPWTLPLRTPLRRYAICVSSTQQSVSRFGKDEIETIIQPTLSILPQPPLILSVFE